MFSSRLDFDGVEFVSLGNVSESRRQILGSKTSSHPYRCQTHCGGQVTLTGSSPGKLGLDVLICELETLRYFIDKNE